jgi:AsmA protein
LSAVTGFKRLGFAILALVLLMFGALAVVSFLIPAEQVRDAVKAEIRAVTGLDPVLRGETQVTLFPTGYVSLSDIILGDTNAEDPPLTAEKLTARLRFFPLLMGRIEVSDVALVSPRIALIRHKDGSSNWAPLLASLQRNFHPKAKSAEKTVSFSEIRITGGNIWLQDEVRGISERLREVDVSLAWPAISKSFAATGRMTWRYEPLEIAVTLADFAAALQGERSGLKVRVAGPPLKAVFDGAIGLQPTLKIDGALSADSNSLRRAMVWAGGRPLPGGGFGKFSLKAQTNVVAGTVALSQVAVEVDGNAAEGVLTFVGDGRLAIQGTLAADEIDLTPYLSAIRLLAVSDREWNRTPLDLEGLAANELDLRLSAAKMTVGSAKLGRTAIAANLRGGRMTVTVGESQAFGGVIKGTLGLAASERGADFRSQLQFTNVDLESCIGELFGIRRIEGKGNLNLTLDGAGPNVHALTRTLNGTATLTGAKGALTGLNVEQLLRRLERRPLSGGSEFRTGRTPFDKLGIDIKVVQGIANVEKVALEGPAVRLSVSGQASIPARDLDLKGTATLLGSTTAEGRSTFELPFVVYGQWDDPVMLPDPQILIRRSGAAAPLLDAVRDRRARDAVRSAIEKLSGRNNTAAQPTAPVPNEAPSPASGTQEAPAAAPQAE